MSHFQFELKAKIETSNDSVYDSDTDSDIEIIEATGELDESIHSSRESIATNPKPPNQIKVSSPVALSDVELTPPTFKSSQHKDPAQQLTQMLANASKINENFQKKTLNSNVNFSYRSFAKHSRNDSSNSNLSGRVSVIHS